MRTPGQRQQNFAHESMMNELAAAAKIDPIQFRLNNTSAQRLITVLNTVKEASGWVTRPSPSRRRHDGLDAGHRPGLQRDAAVGRLLGLRRAGLGRPEDGHGSR